VLSRLGHARAVEVIEKLKVLGVRPSCSTGSRYDADLHIHWWARTVSNRRPLVCKSEPDGLTRSMQTPLEDFLIQYRQTLERYRKQSFFG
jgi:hypothetical protein